MSAEDLLKKAGARVTQPRVQVFSVLLASHRPLTHQQIEQLNRKLDRVTIYRVLEWLVATGRAHRIPGQDGVRRYMASANEQADQHAHFECNECGNVTCLDAASSGRISIPKGYRSAEVQLVVKGWCADCNPKKHVAKRPDANR